MYLFCVRTLFRLAAASFKQVPRVVGKNTQISAKASIANRAFMKCPD